jgi:hypothetical protein
MEGSAGDGRDQYNVGVGSYHADRPFGIYDAQNVRFVDSQIITPEGTNMFSCTNAQVTITYR